MLEKVDKKDYIPVNSGSVHGFAYDVFVLYNAKMLMQETGITKEEAIKQVKEAVAKEDYKIAVHPKYAPKNEASGI